MRNAGQEEWKMIGGHRTNRKGIWVKEVTERLEKGTNEKETQ